MLDINMKFIKGILVIELEGILNKYTSYNLEVNFNNTIKKSEGKYVLLNLNNVNILDKEGIRSIKKCYYQVLKNGGKFMICGKDQIFKEDVKNNYNLYQIKEEKSAYRIANL